MGRIVKYCAKCEESFSEKFSFCPNCASAMTTYEMNPVVVEEKAPETVSFSAPTEEIITPEPLKPAITQKLVEPTPPAFLSQIEEENILEVADQVEEAPVTVASPPIQAEEIIAPVIAAPIVEETVEKEIIPPVTSVPVVPAPTVQSVAPNSYEDYQSSTYRGEKVNVASKASSGYQSNYSNKKLDDDGFYNVTLVQERNSGTRNMLLLGATVLILSISFGSLIYSLFSSDLSIGALDDNLSNIVYIGEDNPIEPEKEEKPKAEKEKEQGGGGGGNKDPNPVSKGRLADELKQPDVPPSVNLSQVTNPELKLNVGVKSDRDKRRDPSTEPYGDPNSKYTVGSDGAGEGGGQGTGRGGGQGAGEGGGFGFGKGGGNGGDGGGRGGARPDDDEPPPKEIKVGPSTPLNITFKPKPPYTDAARQNQVQGTVTLRVTFNANGSIGSISPVSGLPYGLTESAIAAARNMRFEPMKKNGVPQTVTKTLQFTFTMY